MNIPATFRLLTIAIFLSLVSIANAQSVTEKARIDAAVNTAISNYRANSPVVGMSVGVYKDGKTYTYNFGTTKKDGSAAPTDHSLYEIASITKTFAGVLLAQAAVEGKVHLDDDVRKYLDGDYPNLAFEGEPIRLFHLLNHRSGLPNWLPDTPGTDPASGKPLEWTDARIAEVLKNYSRQDFYRDLHNVKLTARPGIYASYSNAGGQLTGYILERVYGVSFETLLRQKIFGPLKMTDTAITLNASQKSRLVTGYDDKRVALPYTPDKVQAAGALKSSVSDLLKYAAWHVVEEDEAVKLSHKQTWKASDMDYSAGLNWQMLGSDGSRLIWQSGNLAGFSGMCAIYPEQKMAIVILTNIQRGRLSAMTTKIAKAIDSHAVPFPGS